MKYVKIMMKTKSSLSVLAAGAGAPIMKAFALFLLFACLPCCFGQTDTNLLATGDWSETVTDGGGHALRGRLLVYDDRSPSAAGHARVYLELQHVFLGGWDNPVEVYFQFGWGDRNGLQFELRDQLDQPIPTRPIAVRMPIPNPYWVTVPCESTVRLRADDKGGLQPNAEGLVILVPGACWVLPPNATNDFFLSATFTPTKDHPSALNYHVWQGTLKLPKVKIPAKKP